MQGFIDESGLFILFIYFFAFYSRWPPKVPGKRFLQKVASRLCRYPVGQKFCQNRSLLLHFQYECIFVFNTEIQDGRQKWRENVFFFCEAMPEDSADSLRLKNRSISLRFRDKHVFPKLIFEKSCQ